MKLKKHHGPILRTAIWTIAWIELIFDIAIFVFALYVYWESDRKANFAIVLEPTTLFGVLLSATLLCGDPKTPEEKGYEIWFLFAVANCVIHSISVTVNLTTKDNYITICIVALAAIPSRSLMMVLVFLYRRNYLPKFVYPGILPFSEVTVKNTSDGFDGNEIPDEVRNAERAKEVKTKYTSDGFNGNNVPDEVRNMKATNSTHNPYVIGWNVPQHDNHINTYDSKSANVTEKGFEIDRPIRKVKTFSTSSSDSD